MGATKTHLAGALLHFAPGPATAGELVDAAKLHPNQKHTRASGAAPHLDAIRSAGKLDVGTLRILARTTTDADTLDWLADRLQKTVKQAVAENSNISAVTVRKLLDYGYGQDDFDCLRHLYSNADPEVILAYRHEHNIDSDRERLASPIAENLHDLDDDKTWLVFKTGGPHLQASIINRALAAERPDWADKAVRTLDSNCTTIIISAITRSNYNIGAVLTDRVVDLVLANPNTAVGRLGSATQLLSFQKITQQQLQRCIDSGNPRVAGAAVVAASRHNRHLLTPSIVSKVAVMAETHDHSPLRHQLLKYTADLFNAHGIDILVAKVRGALTGGTAEELLNSHGPSLKPATVAKLVLRGGRPLVVRYLTGEYTAKPTAGALRAICAERTMQSRFTLITQHTAFVLNGRQPEELEMALNACGSDVIAAADQSAVAAAYVASRLTERFGDDASAWRTAINMPGGLDLDTVDGWLDLVAATQQ